MFEGDCWPGNNDPPEGALDYGLTKEDIYAGAPDLPYDGIDATAMAKTTLTIRYGLFPKV